MALTPKQEAFCRNVASGMSYIDSYKAAYDWSGGDNGASVEALKLTNRDDIRDKIKALTKPLEMAAQTQALTERERKRAVLWNIIERGDDNAKCRALDILNRMDSEYVNITKNIDDAPKLGNLDIDTLVKLSNGV